MCGEKGGWCEFLEGGVDGFRNTGNCFELVSCVSVRLCFNASCVFMFVCVCVCVYMCIYSKFRAES